MLTTVIQLFPIFVYFALGIAIRKAGIAERIHGEFLLRFVFFVTLPLLILTSVSAITFTADKAILPFLNIGVNLSCLGAALLLGRLRKLDKATIGTMIVSTSIVNNSFMFPFTLAVYGQSGFADSVLWDFGNALMMSTVVYAAAFHYGGAQHQRWTMLMRILKSPLVWCLVLSVILSLTHTPIPPGIGKIITPLAQMTAPLILIALGIFTTFKIHRIGLALQTVGIRMVFGLLCGLLLATAAGLEGTTFKVVVLCSAAPIGFNALTYCSMAKLDTELGASAVSLSIIAGLVYIPILILLLGA